MEREYIIIPQEESTKDNGSMIKSMAMELLNMLMGTNLKAIGKMVKDQGKEFTNIRMGIFMKANGFLI